MARDLARNSLSVLLLLAVALAMLVPALHASFRSDHHSARAFFYSALILMVLGGFVAIVQRGRPAPRDPARSLLGVLVLSYGILPLAMLLPLAQALPDQPLLDLWFEMVSAYTTTGATLFDPGALAPSLHLWRALVGWMGGFVMLVAAGAILAPLNLGGWEVMSGRVPGRRMDGLTPNGAMQDPTLRLMAQARQVLLLYSGATVLLWLGLSLAGERGLVAFCHALGGISTSGISPIGGLQGAAAGRWGEICLMLAAGTALSRRAWPGIPSLARPSPLWRDAELRLASAVLAGTVIALALRYGIWGAPIGDLAAAGRSLWGALFTATSFLTTTGYVSADWAQTGRATGLATPGLLLAGLAIMGGGIATTAGGVKLLRIHALFRHGAQEMDRLIHPHAVAGPGLPREGAFVAWIAFMLFALSIAVGLAALTLAGEGFDQALALTLSALTTTGQLAGMVHAPLAYPDLAGATKLILGGLMVLGRLELLALLVLLMPGRGQR